MLRYILLVLIGEALLHTDAIPTGGKGGGCGGGGCGKGGGGGGGKGGGGGGKGGGGKGKGVYGTWNRYSSRSGLVPGHDLDYSIYYDKSYQTPVSEYQLGHPNQQSPVQQYRGDVYTRSYPGQYDRSYQIPSTYFRTLSGYEANHVRDKIDYPTYGYETPLVYQYPQNWLRGYDQGWQTKNGFYQKGDAPLQIPYNDFLGSGERTSLYVRQGISGDPAFDIGYRAKKKGEDDKSERL